MSEGSTFRDILRRKQRKERKRWRSGRQRKRVSGVASEGKREEGLDDVGDVDDDGEDDGLASKVADCKRRILNNKRLSCLFSALSSQVIMRFTRSPVHFSAP